MKKSNMNAFIKKIPKVEAKEIELKDNAFSGMKIQVKPTLNIDEANRFVSQIVDSIVGMEDMTYTPEYFDFVVNIAILENYAGFEMGDCPADQMYSLVYNTQLLDQIIPLIDNKQFRELRDGARERIKFLRDIQTSALSIRAEELLAALEEMISTGNDAVKAIGTDEFKDAVNMFAQAKAAPVKKPRKRKSTEVKETNE